MIYKWNSVTNSFSKHNNNPENSKWFKKNLFLMAISDNIIIKVLLEWD